MLSVDIRPGSSFLIPERGKVQLFVLKEQQIEVAARVREAVREVRMLLHDRMPRASDIRRDKPNPVWFADSRAAVKKEELHAWAHTASLHMQGDLFYYYFQQRGISLNHRGLRGIASLHDTFREEEDHGRVAVERRLDSQEFREKFSDTTRTLMEKVIRWHATTNGDVPPEVRAIPEFELFKTIDKLDRVRLGENIDLERLNLSVAREHFPIIAKGLWDVYWQIDTGDAYEDMIQAGRAICIVEGI